LTGTDELIAAIRVSERGLWRISPPDAYKWYHLHLSHAGPDAYKWYHLYLSS